jgi:glycosyltransferase involved in cell wall biosynthesis
MTNLSAKRISKSLNGRIFDVVLFEYWFSASSVEYFKTLGTSCVLDLHDVLWMKMKTSNNSEQHNLFARFHRNFLINRYRSYEEGTWRCFSYLISINYEETLYLKKKTNPTTSIIDAGTGVDLYEWPYCWAPSKPPIIIFYGSLSGEENEEAALRCARRVMPAVWSKIADAELWLVGANPSRRLQDLTINPLIKVTGFVDDVKAVLSKATAMLCPLTGRYGFRSRLIEAMALGVPLCVTPDAVYGMDIENSHGVFIHDNDVEIAENTVRLARDKDYAFEQSMLERKQVEEKFSFDATYGKIVKYLFSCVKKKERR